MSIFNTITMLISSGKTRYTFTYVSKQETYLRTMFNQPEMERVKGKRILREGGRKRHKEKEKSHDRCFTILVHSIRTLDTLTHHRYMEGPHGARYTYSGGGGGFSNDCLNG